MAIGKVVIAGLHFLCHHDLLVPPWALFFFALPATTMAAGKVVIAGLHGFCFATMGYVCHHGLPATVSPWATCVTTGYVCHHVQIVVIGKGSHSR